MVMVYDGAGEKQGSGDRSQNKEATSNIELPTFNVQREKLCLLSTLEVGCSTLVFSNWNGTQQMLQ
jgi:hypothetical protein